MIQYYQPWLFPFLSLKKKQLPADIARYFYHSFEDALWDLLEKKNVSPGSVFLIPDFYCDDVIQNVQKHGYKVILYPLDAHFQISSGEFAKYVQKYTPAVVIVFHACGITSQLTIDVSWQKVMPDRTIIIEDSVHKLIDPEYICLSGDNQYVMDSLRKVSPLPGCCMYGSFQALSFKQTRSIVSSYTALSFLYYVLFRVTLSIGILVGSSRLVKWAHKSILKKHDDIIGDSALPYAGFSFILPFLDRFNFKKIEAVKSEQVQQYESSLRPLFTSKDFYHISLPHKDFGKLHVYPLCFTRKPDSNLENYLQKNGVPVWFKFPESAWSQKRGVLFLPLGFHVSTQGIQLVAKLLIKYNAQLVECSK